MKGKKPMTEATELTIKQIEVLQKVAELNGPDWKALLDQAWKTRRYFELEGVTLKNCQYLYRLRDKQGTSWLAELEIDALQAVGE